MGKTFSTGLLTNGIWQDASNNVGIGAAPSGSYKLEVTGTAKVSSTLLVSGAATFSSTVTANLSGSLFNANNGALSADILTIKGGGGSGAFGFRIEANNGQAIFRTNNFTYNVLMCENGGNVGIGTTTPATTVHALGKIRSQDPRGGSLPAVEIYGGDSSYFPYISVDQSNPLTFITGAAERMRITSGGELCLNTTSALGSGLFSLQGLTNAYNLIAIKDTGTTYSSTNNNFIYFMQSTGGTCGSISHSTATTVNYYSGPSDARKKENIEDWSQEVLPLFADIKPKTYNHIEDYDNSYVYKGFLAQDMVDKFPEAYGKDKEGFYSFNPSGYIPYLVKALQEQTKINKELNERLNKAGL
jgi:hypothetical protein